jgi:hypothetical protein
LKLFPLRRARTFACDPLLSNVFFDSLCWVMKISKSQTQRYFELKELKNQFKKQNLQYPVVMH